MRRIHKSFFCIACAMMAGLAEAGSWNLGGSGISLNLTQTAALRKCYSKQAPNITSEIRLDGMLMPLGSKSKVERVEVHRPSSHDVAPEIERCVMDVLAGATIDQAVFKTGIRFSVSIHAEGPPSERGGAYLTIEPLTPGAQIKSDRGEYSNPEGNARSAIRTRAWELAKPAIRKCSAGLPSRPGLTVYFNIAIQPDGSARLSHPSLKAPFAPGWREPDGLAACFQREFAPLKLAIDPTERKLFPLTGVPTAVPINPTN